MSQIAIKAALEKAIRDLEPKIGTSFENVPFSPVSSEPYQSVNVLFARPENPTMGDDFYRERGFMQVSLRWPVGNGAGDCLRRAEEVRAAFHRGLSISSGAVNTVVDRTPEIGSGSTEGNRYIINVRIPFFANIGA